MESPKVSIVVPCYQCAGTVEKTVRSVFSQSEPAWELICVNDGSKDDTGAALDRLAASESRMRVIHQENAGAAMARNAGIRAAKAEWVAFVDADDLLLPDALEKLLTLPGEQTDVVCGAYVMRFIDEGGREEMLACETQSREKLFESLIRGDSGLNPMYAKLYRRSLLEDNGILVPKGVKIGEDVLFNLDVFARARSIAACDAPVYVYEYGGDSAMTRAQGDLFRKNAAMIAGVDRFLTREGMKTSMFRAHIDLYIRMLRADYGRLRAAARLSRAMVNTITRDVEFKALCAKQKLYYLALRTLPCLSFFLP